MRDHEPVRLEPFNGLYNRGNIEETPLDHFSECDNLRFVADRSFASRYGIAPHQAIGVPLNSILRMYNYPTQDMNTLLVLVQGGDIYHVVDATTVFGPILSIAQMTDFGFVPYNGRAYITPFTTELVGGLNRERGLAGEFLYVYAGDGTAARKAAGVAPTGSLTIANGAVGHTDAGFHTFGVVFETDTGYLSPPGALNSFTTAAGFSVDFSTIPVSPSTSVIRRHIVASKVITLFNGDLAGYDMFFIPGATINDNVTTTLSGISFFDADLLDDASHLFDNFSEIPAGVNLCIYHNRLCLCTTFNDISLVLVSAIGEPEAISQIDGFCIMPPNGDPITNIVGLRDVLYGFKRNKTGSWVDNGQEPSAWPYTEVDASMGCGVHGLATVIDSGSASTDYLVVGGYTGILLFNGRYILPELTWKVSAEWAAQTFKTNNWRIQICLDSVGLKIYVVMTDRTMLYGDYSNGLDPKKIRWSPWSFAAFVNSIALVNVSELLVGTDIV